MRNNDDDDDDDSNDDDGDSFADVDDIIPEYMRLIDICKIYLIEPN